MAPDFPPVRPELDDIVDRLLALRRLAIERDDFLVTILDLALLHVARQGFAGGVVFDIPLSLDQKNPSGQLSAALREEASRSKAKPEKPVR